MEVGKNEFQLKFCRKVAWTKLFLFSVPVDRPAHRPSHPGGSRRHPCLRSWEDALGVGVLPRLQVPQVLALCSEACHPPSGPDYSSWRKTNRGQESNRQGIVALHRSQLQLRLIVGLGSVVFPKILDFFRRKKHFFIRLEWRCSKNYSKQQLQNCLYSYEIINHLIITYCCCFYWFQVYLSKYLRLTVKYSA